MTTTIRLVDKTGDPDVCAALPAIASCVQLQCNQEVKRAWDLDDTIILVGGDLQPGEWPASIVSSLDVEDALAYHDVQGETVEILVGRDIIMGNGGTVTKGQNSISAAFSHEVLEALIDPGCDFFGDWRDGVTCVCLEICDPVEDGNYEVSDGQNIVTVSNFVHREWFRAGSSAKRFDHLGVLSAPLTLSPGGYVALRNGQQIYGEEMPAWKREIKERHSRRRRADVALRARLGLSV